MSSNEPNLEEQVQAELTAGIRALLATQPQPPDLTALVVQVPTIVQTVVAPSSAVTAKTATFFPSLDVQAKGVLSKIGGAEDIMVVPDSFEMQRGNDAVTLKSDGQINFYGNFVDVAAEAMNVDAGAVRRRLLIDTILVKESLMSGDELTVSGKIWHEHGHVLHGPGESGTVFAHELSAIMTQLHAPAAKKWVLENRKLKYFASTASDTGISEMVALLKELLSAEEFQSFEELRGKVDAKGPAKEHEKVVIAANAIEVGKFMEGTIDDFKVRMGQPTSTDDIRTDVKSRDVVTFLGCTWRVESYMPDDGHDHQFDTYKLTRLA